MYLLPGPVKVIVEQFFVVNVRFPGGWDLFFSCG